MITFLSQKRGSTLYECYMDTVKYKNHPENLNLNDIDINPYLHNDKDWAWRAIKIEDDNTLKVIQVEYFLHGKEYEFNEWIVLTPAYTDEEKIEIKLRGYIDSNTFSKEII